MEPVADGVSLFESLVQFLVERVAHALSLPLLLHQRFEAVDTRLCCGERHLCFECVCGCAVSGTFDGALDGGAEPVGPLHAGLGNCAVEARGLLGVEVEDYACVALGLLCGTSRAVAWHSVSIMRARRMCCPRSRGGVWFGEVSRAAWAGAALGRRVVWRLTPLDLGKLMVWRRTCPLISSPALRR